MSSCHGLLNLWCTAAGLAVLSALGVVGLLVRLAAASLCVCPPAQLSWVCGDVGTRCPHHHRPTPAELRQRYLARQLHFCAAAAAAAASRLTVRGAQAKILHVEGHHACHACAVTGQALPGRAIPPLGLSDGLLADQRRHRALDHRCAFLLASCELKCTGAQAHWLLCRRHIH